MRDPFAIRQAFPARRTGSPNPPSLLTRTIQHTRRPAPAKRRTIANSAGKACLKSKVCEPGRASPIRMDAGFLCDQAGFSCTTHRLTKPSQPVHPNNPAHSPDLLQQNAAPSPTVQARPA